MTVEDFRATLADAAPPPVAPLLRALWHDARGNWDEAHRLAQEVDNPSGAWGRSLPAPQGRRPWQRRLLVPARQ